MRPFRICLLNSVLDFLVALLSDALQFASNYDNITSNEEQIILHAKKSYMFSTGEPWVKKTSTNHFDAPQYQESINKSGYNHKLTYRPPTTSQTNNQRRNRTRNIILYNPPYSRDVTSNIGQEFIKIIDEEFPKDHEWMNENFIWVSMYLATIANWGHYLVITNISI